MYQRNFTRGGSSSSRHQSFHSRGPARGNRSYQKSSKQTGSYIDPSKFVRKAVITEEVEQFIPEHRFEDFAITPELKATIIAKGYQTPTPIQDRAIPYVLKGEDVVGIANTGTGKTAAFLIPLINKVLKDRKEQVLIIVPTRELALQIEDELKGFTKGMQIFSVCCVGGVSIMPQLKALRFKNNFIIGTPGRLKDLIERVKIYPAEFGTIVLDEADRMLDMGFVHDMRAIMKAMPQQRHTLFFSATISREIEVLINEFLHTPVRIKVTTSDTPMNIEQDVVRVGRGNDKLDVLHDLLTQKDLRKVLVFGRTKYGVEKLTQTLQDRGFTAESIHGNKSNAQRQRALGKFKENKLQILVATDVAARGLDIADISHVINYDLPMTYDDYVHRIGRTGRGTKRGKALTFID